MILATAPTHHHPNPNTQFILHTDASTTAVGSILGQIVNGKEVVINFGSRLLNSHEKNYSITELECLVVVWAIKTNRPYLAMEPFTVITDHQALTWLNTNKNLNSRLMRWSLLLQDYDFTIVYKQGKSNIADPLSRCVAQNLKPVILMDSNHTNTNSPMQKVNDAHISCGHGGLGPTLHIIDPSNSNPQLRKRYV